jgi:hypothetical protein
MVGARYVHGDCLGYAPEAPGSSERLSKPQTSTMSKTEPGANH